MTHSRSIFLIFPALAALYLVLGSTVPLVEDEAYYTLWARVPSAGYYDHPPMVAWAIAAGRGLFGDSVFATRIVSMLASLLVLPLVWWMGWRIGGVKSGDLAAAFTAITVPVFGFGFAATPDPFSVLFWTAATAFALEAHLRDRPNFWLGVGLLAGLGVLSKFTNLFFGVGIVFWLLLSGEGRKNLRHWQVWGGAVLGLVVLVPFVIWNQQHDWIGFERQFGRIGEAEGFSAARYLLFWLSLIALVTPLLFVQFLRRLFSPEVPRLLIWLIAPILIYLTWHATKSSAGGQWLVPIYPTLALIAAIGAERLGWVFWSGLALSAAVLVIGLWPNRVLIGGHHPFTQIRGWSEVRRDIDALMAKEGAVWIATDAYGLTGQLAYYFKGDPPVRAMRDPERYLFRSPFPQALCNAPGLFISRTKFTGDVPYFRQSKPLGMIERQDRSGQVLMTYYMALVSGRINGC